MWTASASLNSNSVHLYRLPYTHTRTSLFHPRATRVVSSRDVAFLVRLQKLSLRHIYKPSDQHRLPSRPDRPQNKPRRSPSKRPTAPAARVAAAHRSTYEIHISTSTYCVTGTVAQGKLFPQNHRKLVVSGCGGNGHRRRM